MLENIKIPMEIFQTKKLSVGECLVHYLSFRLKLKQTEIAFLLRRDPRTIWTCLDRAKRKMLNLTASKQPFGYLQRKVQTKQMVKEM